jgi:hypothetical protein
LRADVEILEAQAETLQEKLSLALSANKANDETISKAIIYYEEQLANFAAALRKESEAHNETRKLIATLESKTPKLADGEIQSCRVIKSDDPILEALNND